MRFTLIFMLFFSLTAQAKSLKVFSMNLHCGLGDWKSRMDTVIAEIVKTDPDIIGLQEVCYNDEMNMTSYIVEQLKKQKYPIKYFKTTDTHQSFIKYQEQLLIISKKKVTATLDSSLPSMKFFENRLLGIQVGDLWVVTTHLHFALPIIRDAQYKKTAKMFSDKPAIIFGDMNSNPSNSETEIFHKDQWSHYFPGPSYPSENPTKTFDGFWTSKSFSQKIKSAKAIILMPGLPNPPSDHLGVFINIKL